MAARLARFSWLPGGLAAAFVIVVGRLISSTTYAPVELMLYDRVMRATPANPASDVVLVSVDDATSISRLGAWPWPRDVHANLIDRLNSAGARVVAFSVPIDTSPRTSEAERLRAALALLESSDLGGSEQAQQLRRLLGESSAGRDPDAHLAQAMQTHLVNVPRAYILFEAQQYDSSGYLFNNPKFISLDPAAMPGNIPLKGMRIGVNGAEPHVGQAYRLMDTVIEDANYSAATGQTLSAVGTIIGLEQGPASDEFYLCFDTLGARSDVCSAYAEAVPPSFVNVPRPSDIGFRTFDKINATMAAVTGVSPNTAAVKATFTNIRQSLPAVDSIEAFLSSHQTAIAQLAIQYCDALVESPAAASYFPGLNLGGAPATVFGSNAGKDLLVDPLVNNMVGSNLTSQPSAAELKNPYTPSNTATEGPTRPGLYALIDTLNNCGGSACPASRTRLIAKATCGAVLGSGAVLVD